MYSAPKIVSPMSTLAFSTLFSNTLYPIKNITKKANNPVTSIDKVPNSLKNNTLGTSKAPIIPATL